MANKKITDLQLKSSVVGDESLPVDNGIQTYRVTPSQVYDYMLSRRGIETHELSNLAITTAVGSSALTIALKTKAGTDPTSSDPIRVSFRHATLTNGNFQLRTISGALSLVISSGSTLGQVDAQPSRIWVYLIDNAGTPELAVSHSRYGEDQLVSTTAEGGAGAADSATVIYSASARSNVAIRCIGFIDNTQTTAGTWASAGSQIQLMPYWIPKAPTVQTFTSSSGTYYTPAGCTRIRVRLVGGGGGGGGGTNGSSGTAGGAGGNTTFGTSLLQGDGGSGGGVGAAGNSAGGAGGAASLGTGPIGMAKTGSAGAGTTLPGTYSAGGYGGTSPFGGVGRAGYGGTNAANSAANSGCGGSGGAGAQSAGASYGGGGGGAGGYVDAIISNPLASYAYAIGAAGTAGTANGGTTAGTGGSGFIIVEEYYD